MLKCGLCNCCKATVRSQKYALPHAEQCAKLMTVFTPDDTRSSTSEKATPIASEKGYYFKVTCNLRPNVYWMVVAVPESFTLSQVDDFLRRVWVDCCDHASCFQFILSKKRMGKMLKKSKTVQEFLPVFQEKKRSLGYKYDFGTPSELTLEYLGEVRNGLKVPTDHAFVLLRNTIPVMICSFCEGEAGKYFCRFCYEAFGENCVHHHTICDYDFREEDEDFKPKLPVNSPRLGGCGFEKTKTPDGQVDYPCARPETSALEEEERRVDEWNFWDDWDKHPWGNGHEDDDDEDDSVNERDYDRFFAKKKLRR
jgi:hypothetical protein